MTTARQITRAAAFLLAVCVCALPPRAGGTIPRPEFHAAAMIPQSAPIAFSLSGTHQSSPAAVLTLSDAAVSEFCRNDPVNNSDPLGLAGWTRRGHHLVPVSEIEKIEKVTGTWSDDVVEALDAQRIILASRHGWETGHAQYNLRIRGILEQYLKETKVDPTTITGNAADNWVAGLVRDIERSGDDFIEGYLKMVRSERSVREIGEWAARYRHGVLTGALTGRGVFWLEKNGNDAVQLAGRALAGATTRRGAKLFKLAGPAVVIYFVAASADANQAVEAILPPGVDFAWSYTGRLYDRTIDGAREMGLGHPTPAQLEDEVPFIRGIAQRGVLLRESLERRFSE